MLLISDTISAIERVNTKDKYIFDYDAGINNDSTLTNGYKKTINSNRETGKVKKTLALLILAALTGCKSTNNQVEIDGKHFIVNDGVIVVSKEQARKLRNQKDFIPSEDMDEHISLTPEEYAAIDGNEGVLFNMLNMDSEEPFVALVKSGSLKKNLKRIMEEYGWENLYFEGNDIHIDSPYLIKSNNPIAGLESFVSDFGLSACFELEDRSITVVNLNTPIFKE